MEHVTGADSAFTDAITSTSNPIAALNNATVVATAAANKAAALIAANKTTPATSTFDHIPAAKQQAFLFTQQAVLFHNITKLLIDWTSAARKVTHLLVPAYVT
jgi:hypothetical protein